MSRAPGQEVLGVLQCARDTIRASARYPMKRRPGYYSPSKLQWTVLVAFSMTALTGQAKQPDTVHASSNPPVENMGVLQLKRGYPDLAKTTCETILKADPKNEAALQCLDGALLELEK